MAGRRRRRRAGAPAEGAAAAGTPGGGPVSIWADAGTNALVINAPERVRQDMLAVVNQIDIPRYQVQVDAIIVELTEEKAAQLGVTWVLDGSANNDGVGLTNFSSTTGGIVQLGAAAAGSTPNPASLPDGITLGLGRIRDSGHELGLDHLGARWRRRHEHSLDADHRHARQRGSRDQRRPKSAVRDGPVLEHGSGWQNGNVNPFQTIQREQVGTKLKITPQINEGSGVKLKIEQEISSVAGSASGAVDLVTNNRTITTSVFVNDGDVLMLGGLIDDQLRQGEQRVPGLGRIPGFGWLFRARKSDAQQDQSDGLHSADDLAQRQPTRAFKTERKYRYIQEIQRQMATTACS